MIQESTSLKYEAASDHAGLLRAVPLARGVQRLQALSISLSLSLSLSLSFSISISLSLYLSLSISISILLSSLS